MLNINLMQTDNLVPITEEMLKILEMSMVLFQLSLAVSNRAPTEIATYRCIHLMNYALG